MSDIPTIIDKLHGLIELIDKERERDLILISNDAKALVANRVQNQGKDSDNTPLQKYSDKGVPAYLLYNKEKPNGSIIGDDVDILAEKYGDNVSHKDVREHYGLPTNITNLTYTGEMWNNVGVVVSKRTEDIVEVTIGGLTESSSDKIAWNSGRYGNILELSNDEVNLLIASATERRRKQIAKFFK